MPNLKEFEEEEQVNSEIDIFLAMELGIFSSLKGKNIRFNPRPSSNPEHLSLSKPETPKDITFVDFHIEIAKKVDALIEQHEKELKPEHIAIEFVSKKQLVVSLKDVVEIREPFKKQFETPTFTAEISSSEVFGEFDPRKDLFEVEVPTNVNSELKTVENLEVGEESNEEDTWVDLRSTAVGDQDSNKWFMGLGRIKVKSKKNGVAKTKEELERTKQDIERKRRELEETERIAKEKEEELKIKEKEKIINQKEKEKKIKEKENKGKERIKEKKKKLAEKQKEKELREQTKLDVINEKLMKKQALEAEKQKIIKAKVKERENKERDKKKLLEAKQKERELAILNAQKQKLNHKKTLEKEKQKRLNDKLKERELLELEYKKKKIAEKKQKEAEKQKKLEAKNELEGKRLKGKELERKEEIKKEKVTKKRKKVGISLFSNTKKSDRKKEEKGKEKTVDKQLETEAEVLKVEEKQVVKEELTLDEEVSAAITLIDDLLEQLPDEVIDDFVQSDDFALYEKVVKKYKK